MLTAWMINHQADALFYLDKRIDIGEIRNPPGITPGDKSPSHSNAMIIAF